jgi:hypothetical protein
MNGRLNKKIYRLFIYFYFCNCFFFIFKFFILGFIALIFLINDCFVSLLLLFFSLSLFSSCFGFGAQSACVPQSFPLRSARPVYTHSCRFPGRPSNFWCLRHSVSHALLCDFLLVLVFARLLLAPLLSPCSEPSLLNQTGIHPCGARCGNSFTGFGFWFARLLLAPLLFFGCVRGLSRGEGVVARAAVGTAAAAKSQHTIYPKP